VSLVRRRIAGAGQGAVELTTADLATQALGPTRTTLADGIGGMGALDKGSVDLVLCDLPSGETKAPFDKRVPLPNFWDAVWHCLKPAGNCVLMASSMTFACELRMSSPHFRYDLIWHKSVATGFLNAEGRPLRAHEFVLVFSRKLGTYNPQMMQGASPIHAARRLAHGVNYGPQTAATDSRSGAADRFPTSVLEFPSVGTSSRDRTHPQQKPIELLRWLICTYSNPGELVVDATVGSGSTGSAARVVGRRYLCWDSSEEFGHD